MGEMIIQMRVMPNSPDVDMDELVSKVKKKISREMSIDEEDMKVSLQDIAFGLKAINVYFVVNESVSSFDKLEESLKEIENVSSAEIVDMRRVLG